MRNWLRCKIEALLPWYSAEEAAEHDARTEAIRQKSIAARVSAERLRNDYLAYARRLERK